MFAPSLTVPPTAKQNYMMMQGHKNSVLELHWTADGDNILTCLPDKTLRLWDATTGESVKCMKGHQSFVNACSTAPKGKPLCVSGSDDGTAKLWDFRRKGEVATFADRFQVTAVAFDAEGDRFFSGGLDNVLKCWDIRNDAEPYMVLPGHTDTITGIAVAPDGSVWTANNGRDNVAFPEPGPQYGQVLPDYVDDNPPEQIARLTPGRELGWPYCNNTGGPADLPFVRDVQTNPDGEELDCAALPPVEQSMGAHSAPLGMTFVDGALPEPYGQGALIGVHGSWNRQPPRPPEVSFYPWRDGTLGAQQTFVGGFQNPDGSRWGRPVAAVAGPDGAVYITDDDADAIYRLAPPRP